MDYVITIARCMVCLFFSVLFLQSGFDKFVDWTGNLHYLDEHFEKSVLHKFVMPLLMMLTLMEIGTGVLCFGSVASILTKGQEIIPIIAMSMVCLTLTSLFAGQRLSKDYPGAATVTTYFGVALLGLVLMWPLLPELPKLLETATQ